MRLVDQEIKALLCLNRAASAKAVRQALVFFQEGLKPAEVCERLLQTKTMERSKLFPPLSEFDPEREWETAQSLGIRLVTWFDEDYPASLKNIENAPLVLYVRGSFCQQDSAAIAVVGSREPSFYGGQQAERLARELAMAGITVVSGLARGVDEAAHRGCLVIPHGRTLAVLGCGPDRVYPRENKKLYEAIAERGAVISEFPLGTEPLTWNFPRRNRIISGLSVGVLVVEAHLRSGSLITARLAAEQGRQVFAVPGPIDQWTSRGTHQLLREGAVLVESAQDILLDLGPVFKTHLEPRSESGVESPEQDSDSKNNTVVSQTEPAPLDEALLALLKERPRTTDEILQAACGGAQAVLPVLSRLELMGQIKKTVQGCFSLAEG